MNEFTADALECLTNFSWPGNVRELRTAMEHAVVLCRGERIGAARPAAVRRDGGAAAETRFRQGNDLTVKEAEKQLIARALKETNGNRSSPPKKSA